MWQCIRWDNSSTTVFYLKLDLHSKTKDIKWVYVTISASLVCLACASSGIHTISFCVAEMPAAQHATLLSFPTLIHQAMQIFWPNPPFAHTSIQLEFSNTIWRADWIAALSNITGSLVSGLLGSNKMSCIPFGSLMPLWASFCRSLMCHSEIIGPDSNLLVDLEIIGRQQVSLLSPVRPWRGNPGMVWCRSPPSVAVSSFLFFRLSIAL